MRVDCTQNPFPDVDLPGYPVEKSFPARWIWHPGQVPGQAAVVGFRLPFTLEEAKTLRLHVSADQRYELFLDGRRLGRGPSRGDLPHWFFETYEESLDAGQHLLAARVWWLPNAAAPMAQLSSEPGFLLYAEGDLAETLSTGSGAWQAIGLNAYRRRTTPVKGFHVVGWSFTFQAADYPWGWQYDPRHEGAWVPACCGRIPESGEINPYYGAEGENRAAQRHLVANPLPAMMEKTRQMGAIRYVELLEADETPGAVNSERHAEELAGLWQTLLDGERELTVAPHQRLRVIIDLEDYYCLYPEIRASGGQGASLTLGFAESLYLDESQRAKGNRGVIDNKWFMGPSDRFLLDGGPDRLLDTLWWRAGRYAQYIVETGEAPLTLEAISWRETRYPLEMESAFECSDAGLNDAIPIMHRTIQMCAHETYMDCPYYEQLMYVGDTRLQVLVTYLTSQDTRLPLHANRLFDWSRNPTGLTASRYPSAIPQIIPGFSLIWVAMVDDLFMWRDCPDEVEDLLVGVDAVLSGMGRYLNEDDLLEAVPGWNYCDWVPGWRAGWPPAAKESINALMNLLYAYALQRAAAMHDYFGTPYVAAHWRERARAVTSAVAETFWDEERGLLADDPAHEYYSEHTQALAILTELCTEEQRARLVQGLSEAPDLARTTIYFSHYLFEALRAVDRVDLLIERLGFWKELAEKGFCTTLEFPEPSRSDCHAWGAHPIYHYYASLLGARPAAPSFSSIRIAPQPGPLSYLKGHFPHPGGEDVRFDLRFEGDQISGQIVLPQELDGALLWNGQVLRLNPGENQL